MTYSLLDLPGLLRRTQPARLRIDGQVLDVPAQRKRWQAVLGAIRDAGPQEIELLDDTGNVLARIDADDGDSEADDAPAMGPAMVPEMLAFMQSMQAGYSALFEQQRKVTEHAVETAQALVEAQGGALADAHKRLTAVERLVLRDRERFTLASEDEGAGEEGEADSSLITNLGEIAGVLKYAPMIAPLVGQVGQMLKGAGVPK